MDSIKSKSYDGKQRTLFKKACLICNKDYWLPKHLYQESKFCSPECSSIARQSRKELECNTCGKTFTLALSKLDNSKSGYHFCSRLCKDKAQRIGGIEAIQPEHYKDGQTRYRTRALRTYGSKCCECGYDKHEAMLDVDHIDNNRKNNKIENLQVLCVWCHTLKTRGVEKHQK